ncbi:MAG: 50S ribosomal protein L31 [Candidatus Pacebacteria bacterium RIFOXYB1_FULL_39_46]|nr:MAG: 50S ribosomal protein L31 [Candidatus Pacebacteria bacterium RIFOXYA1_FULL_38_18]OGJ38478.1 MAG: 50S ribosomal protein L31 [Candidatus Pacebacteria bacterium RIFOXYB1_FULL_39_46]OGJ40338.1 MAG: 50S ribosomal protein L31 [Candidatus Pacebacteria bacterium RIFOXYC1_FULL_39_21]OGJ40457.1 MAG: 50S ribosomal protein L31 [Candidatus Pacebacteria bacterium RIFOXYD1_FULL_39_27]
MKANLHPQWHHDTSVTCSCGNTFTTGSTQKTIQVDICSACHPFFTGEMRFVDRQGRVDKFMAKVKQAQAQQDQVRKKVAKKQAEEAKSYQQILQEQKAVLKQSKTAEVTTAN